MGPGGPAGEPRRVAAVRRQAALHWRGVANPPHRPLPPFIEPQLATLVDQAPEGDDWLHELKFDGYRILARLEKGQARLLSRRENDWTAKFVSIQKAVEALPIKSAMIDGEVAVPMADGRTSFQALQSALGGAKSDLFYYVFDLLYLDGADLTGEPLEARKAALKALVARAPAGTRLRFSDHVIGQGRAFFAQAAARQLEGIVSKRRDQPHHRGRSSGWLKIKAIQRQELVIAGFTDPEGSREALGAILVGYYDPAGALIFAGKVGTGFSQKLLRELRQRLAPLEQEDCPFAEEPPTAMVGRNPHWVRPELVGEVAFSEWTHDGRLRHPSFQGLREDKAARDVRRERPGDRALADVPASDGAPDNEGEDVPSSEATTKGKGKATVTAHSKTPGQAATKPAVTATKAAPRTATKLTRPAAAKAHAAAADPAKTAMKRPSKAAPTPAEPAQKKPAMHGPISPRAKGAVTASATSSGGSQAKPPSSAPVVAGETISHPERIIYPDIGFSKLELCRYYEAVMEAMLPHVKGRPLSLLRCPEGTAGTCFYMKNFPIRTSPSLDHVTIKEKSKTNQYLVARNSTALVALAQLGVLEIHTWNSIDSALERPDRFVIDLDPGPEVPWTETLEAARLVRDTLTGVGLVSFVKSTGGKGLHVVVPMAPTLDWEKSLALSRAISELVVQQRPKLYTTNLPKAGRENKILIDYLRNHRGSTSVAAFSTRARAGGTVSVPLAWDELEPKLAPASFNVKTVPHRLATLGQDPWADYGKTRQRLSADLARLLG